MEHSFEELKKKTVAQLREIAAELEHDAVSGYSKMHKEDLLKAVCTALGLDAHEHHVAHIAGKAKIKATIKSLRIKRDEALSAHDHTQLKIVRRKIHHLKRELHKATL